MYTDSDDDEEEKDEMVLWRARFNIARNSMLNKFVFLVLSQLGLTAFLWHWTLSPNDEKDADFSTPPPNISVVLSRFICGIFLHISQEDEIKAAFKMMKYTINHPWKFEHWFIAFLVNFLQFIVLVLVESVCIALLILQENVLDVLMNFISLTIITELDDYLFQTLYENPINWLISNGETKICGVDCKLEEIIKIETTTSDFARFRIPGNMFGAQAEDENEDWDEQQRIRSGSTDTNDFE